MGHADLPRRGSETRAVHDQLRGLAFDFWLNAAGGGVRRGDPLAPTTEILLASARIEAVFDHRVMAVWAVHVTIFSQTIPRFNKTLHFIRNTPQQILSLDKLYFRYYIENVPGNVPGNVFIHNKIHNNE